MAAEVLPFLTWTSSAQYASASPQHDAFGTSGCISAWYHCRTAGSEFPHCPRSRELAPANTQEPKILRQKMMRFIHLAPKTLNASHRNDPCRLGRLRLMAQLYVGKRPRSKMERETHTKVCVLPFTCSFSCDRSPNTQP